MISDKVLKNESPKISVITINYNNNQGLIKTIASVKKQTYLNIEYILIDGGSTDGSVELIEENSKDICFWVSEPDKGIYDAMNKGIGKVTGEWIIFLNSGDYFSDAQSLELAVATGSFGEPGLVYGSCFCEFEDGSRQMKTIQRSSAEIWKGPFFRHNAMLIHAETQRKNPYEISTSMKVAADFDFIYKMYANGVPFRQLDSPPLIVYEFGGISYNLWRAFNDNFRIYRRYGPHTFGKYRYHIKKLMNFGLRRLLGRK